MNKSITLENIDWKMVIAGLSYSYENAEEEGWDDDAADYLKLINQITEQLDKQ
jgi:hypothetical protein